MRRGDFSLDVGEFRADPSGTALIGRNGAGKSTLLLALQGLIEHRGSIARPVRCAGVFAQPAVLRGSVLWNVEVVLRSVARVPAAAARQRAENALTVLGLSDARALDARRLSSGQRQRLALARALAVEPQALFLDEPFANVDADGRPTIRRAVRDYVSRSGCALVMATQNLADVRALCATVAVLENGKIVELVAARAIGAGRHPYLQALEAEARVTPR